jgi:hypothetical protein
MPDIQAVTISASVMDSDLYVFGPPGSGSVICTDPDLDPSINKQKKQEKP